MTSLHPNPSQIRSLTQMIRAEVSRHPEPVLALTASTIYQYHRQTIACLAGWCALAKTPLGLDLSEDGAFDNATRDSVGYATGARQFAQSLGYESVFGLMAWSKAFPDLWGNSHGEYMFTGFKAYGLNLFESDRSQPVTKLLDYWNDVANRIQKHLTTSP